MNDTLAHFVLNCSGDVSDEDVQSMLCSGSDIHAFAICCTALGWAARYGNTRLVTTLLRHGAPIEVGTYDEDDVWDLSPLYLAIQHRHTHVAQLLIDSGADINSQSSSGYSLFHRAIASDSRDCLALLLEAGFDLNADRGEWMVALCKSESDNIECLPLLLAGGGDKMPIDDHGYFRLMCGAIARGGCIRRARLLIAAFVPIDCPWLTDSTLQSCTLSSPVHQSMIQMLVDAGANLLSQMSNQLCAFYERRVQRHVLIEPKEPTILPKERASARFQFFESLEVERRMIARARLDLVREQASEICIGLQALELPAWVTIQILEQACRFQSLVSLHSKWNLVTAIEHFKYTSDAD